MVKPSPVDSALLHRPPPQRPPLQSLSELHDPHLLFEHRPTLQSESELHDPHRPLEHRPLPPQSESELHDPHLPLEHRPSLQSESELHDPHLPLEQRPWPLQSESELHDPHLPFEHRPTPAQSESELQFPADAVRSVPPNSPATNTIASAMLRTTVIASPSPRAARPSVRVIAGLRYRA